MSRKATKPRIAWEDRFQFPGADDLVAPFHKQQAALIALTREGLCALSGVVETIEWRGVPWRWSFVYRMEGDESRPWAYLVPQPGKPVLSIPLRAELAGSTAVKKLSRTLRDAVQFSTQVAGVYWPQWELTSRPQAEEILGLARKKHESLLEPTVAGRG